MRSLITGLTLGSVLLVSGCGLMPGSPRTFRTPDSLTVSAPTAGKVGQPLELRVEAGTGMCDALTLEAPLDATTKTVTVKGTVADVSPTGTCASGLIVQTMIVKFTPTEPGTYTIKGTRNEVKVEVSR